MILDDFKTSNTMERNHSTLDLERLHWRGDTVSDIRAFRQDWETLESNLSPDIPESERIEVVLDRMSQSKVLEQKMDVYKELRRSSKKRTLRRLLDIMDNYLKKDKDKQNQEKKMAAMPGAKSKGGNNNALAASLAKAPGGKPVCMAFLK